MDLGINLLKLILLVIHNKFKFYACGHSSLVKIQKLAIRIRMLDVALCGVDLSVILC